MKDSRVARGAIGRRQFVCLSAAAGGAMLLGLNAPDGARASEAAAQAAGQTYQAGVYTASAQGRKGPVTVEVAFDETSIVDIRVVESFETPRIAATAMATIPAQVVEYQSLGIDTVTGSTFTSMALLNAIEDCVEQAGGDVKALEKVAGPGKSTEVVELEADVCVIGAGAAGTATAVRATQNGKKVVVFEKVSNIGGNALVSGGVLTYLDAPQELRQPMNDAYRSIFEDFMAQAPGLGVTPEQIAVIQEGYDAYYAAGNTTTFLAPEWNALINLVGQGGGDYQALLDYSYTNKPLLEWLSTFDIDWDTLVGISGYPYPSYTHPKRGSGGEGYFYAFDKAMNEQSLPIDILFCTPAKELLRDESGAVVGATGVCDDGTTYSVKAASTVICTGGYSGSTELMQKNDHGWGFDQLPFVPTDNAYGHTGDGLLMAQAVGGAYVTDDFNYIILPLTNAMDHSVVNLVGETGNCLLVNQQGERFVDETGPRNDVTRSLMQQTDQLAYIVCDEGNSNIADGFTMEGGDVELMLRNGWLYKADTLEELAAACGLPADALLATVAEFNGFAEQGSDPVFGRTSFNDRTAIDEGPFYACPVTWSAHITCDGLLVDDTFNVLTEEGTPVKGLYAAGEVIPGGGGLDVFGYGLALGDILAQ